MAGEVMPLLFSDGETTGSDDARPDLPRSTAKSPAVLVPSSTLCKQADVKGDATALLFSDGCFGRDSMTGDARGARRVWQAFLFSATLFSDERVAFESLFYATLSSDDG